MKLRTGLLAAVALFMAGCAGASVAPEVRVAALTFTPSPGMSRLYVFRADKLFGSGAALKVAVNGHEAATMFTGSFMMVEVEPGHYRVSGLSLENEDVVEVEALPDSVYFFKIWPKMGFFAAQAGVGRMEAVEGRKAVEGVTMVKSKWPPKKKESTP